METQGVRRFYRDGIEQRITGPIHVSTTTDGHIVESYTLAEGGQRKYFATLAGSHWCAHGDTVAEAIANALWKDPSRRPSLDALVSEIQGVGITRKITLNEFKLLTGACSEGCRVALAQAKQDATPLTAHEIRDLISREWGDKLLSILGWADS